MWLGGLCDCESVIGNDRYDPMAPEAEGLTICYAGLRLSNVLLLCSRVQSRTFKSNPLGWPLCIVCRFLQHYASGLDPLRR